MALGKRKARQAELFVATAALAKGSGHPFYTKLNAVLAEAGFDDKVEELCAPFYKEGGRPSIPPGVYFRMLFIGYFEGPGQPARDRVAVRRQPGPARFPGDRADGGDTDARVHDDHPPAAGGAGL